eukprot:Phypoly_transcript_25747.p1 GENE.Phypoly_transcript_25747~~Phypoly_transcript_25747.p1  ORF type:complete len:149 (+),score=17.85 Phypoly_transcript_25747:35-448(+)
MTPPPTSENIPQLSKRDVARIVQCLKVVVKVVDAGETAQKVAIAGKIAAHTTRISELQQKIKDVEHKALVHQMEARLAQIRLQQMELSQLIQYANKLMEIRKREQELLTLTNSLHSRINMLKGKINDAGTEEKTIAN